MTQQTALQIAFTGRTVFPANPADKSPLVKWRERATTDPSVIKTWWSRWPQAMVGLPCGPTNDLFVLDLDTDKETGEDLGVRSLMECGHGRLLDGPSVRTPSGGLHLYFRHWDGARNTVGALGSGIDTRGPGGYVIAAGSVSDTGPYLGKIDLDALPSVPLTLRAALARPERPRPVPHGPSETASDAEVEELLSFIPPDLDYQTWLSVLMALHDCFGGGLDGLEVADRWSAQGDKYRPGGVSGRWTGFTGEGVTWATVPALAREYGADLAAIARKHRRATS